MAVSTSEHLGNLFFHPASTDFSAHLKPGYYSLELNKTLWEIPDRYKNLQPLGHGAYGSVWYHIPFIFTLYVFYNFICILKVLLLTTNLELKSL